MNEYYPPKALPFFENRFRGQVVGVTGGGSTKNLAYAAAKRLLKEGASVMLYDLPSSGLVKAQKSLEGIAKLRKTSVGYHEMDITQPTTINQALEHTLSAYGRLDAIVNCAGITGNTGKAIEESDAAIFENIIRVNLVGSYHITRAVVPIMKQQGYGRILLVASIAGVVGNPNMIGYATSKAGVVGIIKSVGEELAAYNKDQKHASDITINGIAPVVIQTPMVEQNPQSVIDAMKGKIPSGRFATLEEFAAKGLFIISPEHSATQGFIEDLSLGRRRM